MWLTAVDSLTKKLLICLTWEADFTLEWLTGARLNIFIFSWAFPPQVCCLMISQWLLQAKQNKQGQGSGKSLKFTSHWPNPSHMALSAREPGKLSIWLLHSLWYMQVSRARSILHDLPQRRQNSCFSKADSDHWQGERVIPCNRPCFSVMLWVGFCFSGSSYRIALNKHFQILYRLIIDFYLYN